MSRIERAVRIYSKLFALPSTKILLIFSLLLSLFMAFLSNISFYLRTLDLIIFPYIICEGIIEIWGSLIISAIMSLMIIKGKTKVLNFRRLVALNTFSVILLYAVYGLSALVSIGNYGVAVFSLIVGIAIMTSFRIITCYSISQISVPEVITISTIQPFLLILLREVLLNFLFPQELPIPSVKQYVIPLILILLIFLFSTSIYLKTVNSSIKSSLGVGGLDLFKAFIAEWTEQEDMPLEALLTRIGEERTLPVAVICFKNIKGRMKAILVIPTIHPGPFKTIGSSLLPHFLAKELKQKTGAEVIVLHGSCDHSLNLTSKNQLQYVLDEIIRNINDISYVDGATSITYAKEGTMTVKTQTLGDLTLIIATRSPLPMDDISLGVGLLTTKIIEKEGSKKAFFVDAHNCMGETFEDVLIGSETAKELILAAQKSFKQLLNMSVRPLKIGVAKGRDINIPLEKGLGSDGVSVLLMEIGSEYYAYVVFDSNNLDFGLREQIIDRLRKEFGIKDAEVMTTDTHEVNAVSPSKGGYVPLGRGIDCEELITYVVDLTKQAEKNMEPVKVGSKIVEIPKLKVMGEHQVSILTSAVLIGYSIAKNAAIATFIPTLVASILFLLLFI